jgi:hypothetical protein
MTTSIALDLPTWTGPAWATEHEPSDAGMRWGRRAATAVTQHPEPIRPEGAPIRVEAVAFDHLEVVVSAVLVEREQAEVFVGGLLLDLDGARNLIAALTELVEAVEEGTR